ncbi:MAG: hypothetical protein LBJ95_04295 [Oscillospiraceae bacterium]|nr:hypothetical protein [Oscillospiraceae bacterium]
MTKWCMSQITSSGPPRLSPGRCAVVPCLIEQDVVQSGGACGSPSWCTRTSTEHSVSFTIVKVVVPAALIVSAKTAVCSWRAAAAKAAAKVSDISFFAIDFIKLLPFGIKYKFKKFEHFLINGHVTNWCAGTSSFPPPS